MLHHMCHEEAKGSSPHILLYPIAPLIPILYTVTSNPYRNRYDIQRGRCEMELERYFDEQKKECLMGPNSLRILDELLKRYAQPLKADGLILDLGCGKGLTSFALHRETGARVLANDLWISAEENAARFAQWGAGESITPVHENADCLRFEENSFDAIVSIDSYHYFAGTEGYFSQKILPYIKPGGVALFGVPGIREVFDSRTEELLSPWLGDEAYMLRSPRQWRRILGDDAQIASVEVWEMDCFEAAWRDWLSADNDFARGDLMHFETIIRPYTNFVGMIVRKNDAPVGK